MLGGSIGRTSQLALVKIKNSMKKAVRKIKRNCLKAAEKKTEVKEGDLFKGRANFPIKEIKKGVRTKVGKFLEGNHSFLMSQEKQKVVIKQKNIF